MNITYTWNCQDCDKDYQVETPACPVCDKFAGQLLEEPKLEGLKARLEAAQAELKDRVEEIARLKTAVTYWEAAASIRWEQLEAFADEREALRDEINQLRMNIERAADAIDAARVRMLNGMLTPERFRALFEPPLAPEGLYDYQLVKKNEHDEYVGAFAEFELKARTEKSE